MTTRTVTPLVILARQRRRAASLFRRVALTRCPNANRVHRFANELELLRDELAEVYQCSREDMENAIALKAGAIL